MTALQQYSESKELHLASAKFQSAGAGYSGRQFDVPRWLLEVADVAKLIKVKGPDHALPYSERIKSQFSRHASKFAWRID